MTADNQTRQCVSCAVAPFLSLGQNIRPPCNLRLHPQEDVLVDDCLVAAFHIVLRHNAVVGNALLFERVDRIGFLQECIPDVFLVGENLFDVALIPPGISGSVQDSVRFKSPPYLQEASAVHHVLRINAHHDGCLFRDNNQLSILVLCVSEEAVMVDLDFALLIAKLDAQPDASRSIIFCEQILTTVSLFHTPISQWSELLSQTVKKGFRQRAFS